MEEPAPPSSHSPSFAYEHAFEHAWPEGGGEGGGDGGGGGPEQLEVNEPTPLLILRLQLTEANEHPALAFVHALALAFVFITLPLRNAL